jgi:hypothetical protein
LSFFPRNFKTDEPFQFSASFFLDLKYGIHLFFLFVAYKLIVHCKFLAFRMLNRFSFISEIGG